MRWHHQLRRRRRGLHQLLHRATLVNSRLRWVKDPALDAVVTGDRHLPSAHALLHRIPLSSVSPASISDLLPRHKAAAALPLLLRYPTLFVRFPRGSRFSLSPEAAALRCREISLVEHHRSYLVDSLRRLLMLSACRAVPLHTVDLLRWDIGLPLDYRDSLLLRFEEHFEVFRVPGDEREWVRLLSWDAGLAVPHIIRSRSTLGGDIGGDAVSFPISFPRGFGLDKKWTSWLKEWQTLPYVSPYEDPSGIDPRTDESEKRNVGVFHELLHLTLARKTERHAVSNMRKLLRMPQKFTKVFERHPGIFYLSQKMGRQTVVLREAYDANGVELFDKHPLLEIRKEYSALMRASIPRRRRPFHRPLLEGGSESDSPVEDGDEAL